MQSVSPTSEEAGKLLERLVARFNAAVRTCDFSEYLELFTEDAAIDFEGVPERGPIEGKAALVAHFRDDPPDDQIRVTRWKYDGMRVIAQFVWTDIPEASGGVFVIVLRDHQISRLTLAFGGPAARWRT
jgi:hypothetical protein